MAATIAERKRELVAGSWNKGTTPQYMRPRFPISRTAMGSRGKRSSDTRIAHYTLSADSHNSQIGAALFKDNKPQRPSKRARQRIKKKEETSKVDQAKPQNPAKRHTSESGYETTGDTHTPTTGSPVKSNSQETDKKDPLATKQEFMSTQQLPNAAVSQNLLAHSAEKDYNNKRTDSTSSFIGVPITDVSLKKQLKDLQRCDKCITKYEMALRENCDVGMKMLKDIFSEIREEVSLREEDLLNDLVSIKNTASKILQRRKETASFLKKAVENSSTLEDVQIEELKQQLKQFVTDRKVDEEIGTINRFDADQDDIIPQIMGFGKVNDVRHLYTAWEEDPGAMIEMSRYRTISLSSLAPSLARPIDFTSAVDAEYSDDIAVDAEHSDDIAEHSDDIAVDAEHSDDIAEHSDDIAVDAGHSDDIAVDAGHSDDITEESASDSELKQERDSAFVESFEDSVKLEDRPVPPEEVAEDLEALSAHDNSNECAAAPEPPTEAIADTAQAEAERGKEKVIEETSTQNVSNQSHSTSIQSTIQSEVAVEGEHTSPTPSPNESNNSTTSTKYKAPEQDNQETLPTGSPTRLHTIVLLKAPKIVRDKLADLSIRERFETDSAKALSSYSPEQLVVIQSRVRESLQQQGVLLYDPVTGARPLKYQTQDDQGEKFEIDFIARKKKTPTQLRRERKKRQRERERRQKELGDKIRREIENSVAASAHDSSTSSYSTKSATYSSSESLAAQQSLLQDELCLTDQNQKRKKKYKATQADSQDTDDNDPAATGTDSDNTADSSSDRSPSSIQDGGSTHNTGAEPQDSEQGNTATNDVAADQESSPAENNMLTEKTDAMEDNTTHKAETKPSQDCTPLTSSAEAEHNAIYSRNQQGETPFNTSPSPGSAHSFNTSLTETENSSHLPSQDYPTSTSDTFPLQANGTVFEADSITTAINGQSQSAQHIPASEGHNNSDEQNALLIGSDIQDHSDSSGERENEESTQNNTTQQDADKKLGDNESKQAAHTLAGPLNCDCLLEAGTDKPNTSAKLLVEHHTPLTREE